MRALIGTRKGLFRLERRRAGWRLSAPHFLGAAVTCARRDPRDGTIHVALEHGHWGPKLHRSRDDLASFEEIACPAFGANHADGVVRRVMVLAPAGAEGRLLAGTDPGGLFETTDSGESWSLNEPLWALRSADRWFPSGGGVMLHSIEVEQERPAHLHVAVSCGGVYASEDAGSSWQPRNQGVPADYLPGRFPETGQDPHLLLRHPHNPLLLWQQNHCGNFRSTDGGLSWQDATPGLPTPSAFALALDEQNEQAAWTIPMDSDAARVAPGGALEVCRTDDGGRTWIRLRSGLPQTHCYDIVFRHALDAHAGWVLFGTTCGRLFVSGDRGDSWQPIEGCLPPVNSVAFER